MLIAACKRWNNITWNNDFIISLKVLYDTFCQLLFFFSKQPLFIDLSIPSLHTTTSSNSEVLRRHSYLYRHVQDETRRNYLSMVSYVDEAIGNITEALKNKDMWQNSVLVFSSGECQECLVAVDSILLQISRLTHDSRTCFPRFFENWYYFLQLLRLAENSRNCLQSRPFLGTLRPKMRWADGYVCLCAYTPGKFRKLTKVWAKTGLLISTSMLHMNLTDSFEIYKVRIIWSLRVNPKEFGMYRGHSVQIRRYLVDLELLRISLVNEAAFTAEENRQPSVRYQTSSYLDNSCLIHTLANVNESLPHVMLYINVL